MKHAPVAYFLFTHLNITNMNSEEKKRTADTVEERSVWILIGLLPIRLRPLTLGQIYEMGQFACDMEASGLDLKARIVASAEMLARWKSARLMQEVFLVCAFRRHWKRRLFRRYVLNRLTVGKFQRAVAMITDSFTANFFLTSIIFLSQTNMMSEPNPTTRHGQQSGE